MVKCRGFDRCENTHPFYHLIAIITEPERVFYVIYVGIMRGLCFCCDLGRNCEKWRKHENSRAFTAFIEEKDERRSQEVKSGKRTEVQDQF